MHMYVDLDACKIVFLTVLFNIYSAYCIKRMESQRMKDLKMQIF